MTNGRHDERGMTSRPDPERRARAQPGDVLGIERGGETTSLGDTEEDEDLRRRELEKTAEGVDD